LAIAYENFLEDDPFVDTFPVDEAVELITAEPPPPEGIPQTPAEALWYLGLDFGTTGISAVLLNYSTCHLYPLYWTEPQHLPLDLSLDCSSERLPASSTEIHRELKFRLSSALSCQTADSLTIRLHDFKPHLKLGIPQQTGDRWQPLVQWSDTQQIPLIDINQALQDLLADLLDSAEALELESALPQLTGVAIGCPAHWSDIYRANLQQIVQGALTKLRLAEPHPIYFVEDSIAALLSTLNSGDGREIILPRNSQRNAAVNEDSQLGNTLVLIAGAMTTELAIIRVSRNPSALDAPVLSRDKIQIRSIPFAGHAIDQDIICQLIYPFLSQGAGENGTRSPQRLLGEGVAEDFVAEAIDLTALAFQDLKLPRAGELDEGLRSQLQQRLESCPSGHTLLDAARYIKLILQQQSRCRLKLGNGQQVILRQDLGSQVLLPYIQRLNRELNALLNQTDLTVTDINQVICTGGTASLGAIARWLRQKLPNATITQDTYRSVPTDRCLPGCSRIAYGLALLPLHPQLLEQTSR